VSEKKRILLKFGGESLATSERQNAVADFIAELSRGAEVIVVPSAFGEETDILLAGARVLNPKASGPALDMYLSTGEIQSAARLALMLEHRGVRVAPLNVHQIGMRTTDEHEQARVKQILHPEIIEEALATGAVVIVPGFQGINARHATVTLGRGGSDLSAVVIAAAAKAECRLFKDVDGIYAVDPRIVPNAKRFSKLTFEQMLLLAKHGAGVIMDRAVRVALVHGVALHVLRSPSVGPSDGGTTIIPGSSETDVEGVLFQPLVALIAQGNISRVAIRDVPDVPGQLARLDRVFSKIQVFGQTQDPGECGKATVVYLVKGKDAEAVTAEIQGKMNLPMEVKTGLAALTIINAGQQNGSGALERRSQSLANAGLNIRMSLTKDDITTFVAEADLERAANTLAVEFDLVEK